MKFIVKVALLFLIVNTLSAQQWRDSSFTTVPNPSGKAVKITQFSIGDTNSRKTEGALAYMNSGFYIANGSYFQLMGSTVSTDTATFVTKGSTQVVTSPKYYTARQYMTSMATDTIVSRTSGMVYLLNNFTLGGNELSDAILVSNVTFEGNSIDTTYTNAVSKINSANGVRFTKNAKDYTPFIDSVVTSGTTRATSGTWHSGIGAWSLGNLTTGTINAGSNSITTTGAINGGYFDGDSLVLENTADVGIRLIESGNSGFKLYYDGDGTNNLVIGSGTGGSFTERLNITRDAGALTLSGTGTINSGLNTIVLTLSDVTTDATNKLARFGAKHYTNSEEPVAISFSNNTTSANTLNWGGGTGLMNSATVQNWYIGATNTTVTGTLTMILDAGRLTLGSTAGTGINDLVADDGSFAGKVVVEDSLRIDETGIPITKAVVDSNALEFTASSVEYRAKLPAFTKLYHDTSTAYSITLGTADSFYTVKNWNQSLGVRKNMTITDSSIIVRVAGYYQVQYSLSSGSTSANTVLQTSIFQNFSRKSGTSAQQKIATANDIGNMTGLGIMYCNVGDYIQLRVRRSSGAGSCEITEGQLVVTRID